MKHLKLFARNSSIALFLSLALVLLSGGAAGAAVTPLQDYGVARSAGAGGVMATSGIGIDPISGKVVIADPAANRVAIFRPNGKFLLAFGTDVDPGGGDGLEVCRTDCKDGDSGDGAGQFIALHDVAVSPDGKLIYLSDAGNYRVSVFTMRGEFKFAFGRDVDPAGGDGPEVCTTECQSGASGEAAGTLPYASDLAFGPDGDLYVANNTLNRIERFSPAGQPVAAYGHHVDPEGGGDRFESCVGERCVRGIVDYGAGSLFAPEGIAFDPEGRIWVGSSDGNYVSVVTTAPSFAFGLGSGARPGHPGFGVCRTECSFDPGIRGDGPGELHNPRGIAVDARGTAYVADAFNDRINAYRPNGEFRFAFGYDVAPGGDAGLEICTTGTGCGQGAVKDAFDIPASVAVDCRGTIFTASQANGVYSRGGLPARPGASAFGLSKKAAPGPCRLKLGKAKLNRKRGIAKLKVLVPYAGNVVLNGKGIKRARGTHSGLEGNERLAVKPNRKLKRKLRKRGKARVRVTVKMRPSDGNVVQERSKRITLKAKKERKKRR